MRRLGHLAAEHWNSKSAPRSLSILNENPSANQLDRYYNSPVLSDVIIRIGDRRIHAHKMILSLSSPYFRSAFTGPFVESGAPEMPLHDDDPESVEGMIRYIYGVDYRSAVSDPGPDYCLRIFTVAGKYDVQGLVKRVTEHVKEELEKLLTDPSSFAQLVRSIWTATPAHRGELRSIAKDTCWKNYDELTKTEDFKEMLSTVPELSFELLQRSVEEKRASEEDMRQKIQLLSAQGGVSPFAAVRRGIGSRTFNPSERS